MKWVSINERKPKRSGFYYWKGMVGFGGRAYYYQDSGFDIGNEIPVNKVDEEYFFWLDEEEITNFYFIKAFKLPFQREWFIFNDWVSEDKKALIEKVREDLENEVLLKPITLTEHEGWLFVNESKEKWLQVAELKPIS